MDADDRSAGASFGMPSTSGRSCCHFVVDNAASTTLRLRYTWSVYSPDSDEPTQHQVLVPSLAVCPDRLRGFAEQVRACANALGSQPPPSTLETDLASSPGHRVRLELRPGDPSLITSPWQAVFA